MTRAEARNKLVDEVRRLLPKIEVRDGQYELIFTDGYMMIWKYIRDYAKSIGANPRKIKRGGVQDPVFIHMNNFMYPLGGEELTVDATAELIARAADSQIDQAMELEAKLKNNA